MFNQGRCQRDRCSYHSDLDVYYDDGRPDESLCSRHASELWDDKHMIQAVPQHGGPSMNPMVVKDDRPMEPTWADGTPMRKETMCFALIYGFYQIWWGLRDEGDNFKIGDML